MPPDPTPIEVTGLTKRFGRGQGVLAVDDLTFRVEPGRITGFLGPNGAGKTTTLRCLVGLVKPTSGSATVGGKRYHQLHRPPSVVGAALESTGFHPGRTARNHLRIRATALGLPSSRADEMLAFVGLGDTARRKAGQFSLGMRQRLALALALVGDPPVLVLDEPANGLDPAGIAWLRRFLRSLAAEGRTILVSSHLLAEMRQTADDIVIIDRGRLVRQGSLAELVGAGAIVRVAGPDGSALAEAMTRAGGTVASGHDGSLRVSGLTSQEVGHVAWQQHLEIHELMTEHAELEDVYLHLTTELGAQPTPQPAAGTWAPTPGAASPGGPPSGAQPAAPGMPPAPAAPASGGFSGPAGHPVDPATWQPPAGQPWTPPDPEQRS